MFIKPKEPLPLYHSWPLFLRDQHFQPVVGRFEPASGMAIAANVCERELAERGIGLWECDLRDNSLSWSAGVYDLFGIERSAPVSRDHALSLYSSDSREVMQRLRAYAIKHRRGFTIDVELQPASGKRQMMRLSAAPICEGRKVTHLHGWKQAI